MARKSKADDTALMDGIVEKAHEWRTRRGIDQVQKAPDEFGGKLEVCYTPADIARNDYERDIGFPGEFPYTRGVYPAMYRDRLWQMRLYSGFGTAEDTNQRWRYLLAQGNNGVSCAFDLPTQCGYDSDHPDAQTEVGRVGVAVDTVRDMEIMFDGLPMDRLAISLNAHSTAPMLLAMFLATAERVGVRPDQLTGSMTTDVLKDYVARGTWIYPPGHGLRLVADTLQFCSEEMPRFYPLVIRGPDMRDAGADLGQELGFAFANGIAYLDYATRIRGMDIDSFANRLSAQFYFYGRFLQEAAKARAARRIWARLLRDRYGAKKDSSLLLRITASVGGSHFQAADPEANIVRGTLGCLGAVLGGSQGMLLAGYDEAYDIPTEHTQRLALRTQQVVGYESDATETVDPLAGSYYVEAMTDRIEKAALGHMNEIEAMGGAVRAIEQGHMQRAISESAYRTEIREQSGERVLVAVNKFQQEQGTEELKMYEADPLIRDRQIGRLNQVRSQRDERRVTQALHDLKVTARTDRNLMPLLVEAARADASLGEMVDTLRQVFGEFHEPSLR